LRDEGLDERRGVSLAGNPDSEAIMVDLDLA
jgi:hypothetical protein